MKLSEIQQALKVPKNNRNSFGNYNYRSAEDIVEAVKKIINPQGLALVITDDIVEVGGRIYVKATATIRAFNETTGKVDEVSATGWAREEETKKGMDVSQITGSASSYARKYALNGLLAIDDTKDADATNDHKEEPKNVILPQINDVETPLGKAIMDVRGINGLDALNLFIAAQPNEIKKNSSFQTVCRERQKVLKSNLQ